MLDQRRSRSHIISVSDAALFTSYTTWCMLWKSLRNKSWGHMMSRNRHKKVKLWSKKVSEKISNFAKGNTRIKSTIPSWCELSRSERNGLSRCYFKSKDPVLWQTDQNQPKETNELLRRLMVFTRHVRPLRCHSCMQHLTGLGGVSSASMHPFFLPFHPDTYLGKLQTLIYFWSL